MTQLIIGDNLLNLVDNKIRTISSLRKGNYPEL